MTYKAKDTDTIRDRFNKMDDSQLVASYSRAFDISEDLAREALESEDDMLGRKFLVDALTRRTVQDERMRRIDLSRREIRRNTGILG